MKDLPRNLIILALLALTIVLFRQAQAAYQVEDADATRVVMLFGAVVLVGATAGGLMVVAFLPHFGDAVGNALFHPNEKIEKDPHADAMGAIARGDYHRAIEEYQKVFAQDPNDTLALSEMARIYCEKLQEPEAAASLLEDALQRELETGDAAFLCSRLADVYWNYQHDIVRARELLMQVIETMPNTRHSANASHRLQEIERQLVMQG
jgi:tetratricopeptide (TPR) repeat protein